MFLDETHFDSRLCAFKKGRGRLHPPMDLILCTFYPLLPESSGPVTVTGVVEHSFSEEGTSVSQIREGSQQQCILALSFWRRGETELLLVDILTGWACGSRCWISCHACAASYRCRQAKKGNQKSC